MRTTIYRLSLFMCCLNFKLCLSKSAFLLFRHNFRHYMYMCIYIAYDVLLRDWQCDLMAVLNVPSNVGK